MTIAEVIVVASDAAFRHSLVFVLESGGFRVLSDGALGALASPRSLGAGCAVIDEEAIPDRKQARQLFRTFARPVILLVERSRNSPSGAVRYLTKPFLGEPLLQAVHEAIGGKA